MNPAYVRSPDPQVLFLFIFLTPCSLAAFSFRKAHGLPTIYPKTSLKYTANILHMMFSHPGEDCELKPEIVKALDLIFLLHADHEQNCSTSTVRMVASSRANLFASASAGVCALWGPLHGGANQAVLETLEEIHADGDDGTKFLNAVKDKTTHRRLTGFGHRVYKNFDPRAVIIKQRCDRVLAQLHKSDPLLDIAKKLEEIALHDEYSFPANSIQTSISIAASSCGPSASQWTCSRSCLPSAACPAGLPTSRKSWKTEKAASPGHARFTPEPPSASTRSSKPVSDLPS